MIILFNKHTLRGIVNKEICQQNAQKGVKVIFNSCGKNAFPIVINNKNTLNIDYHKPIRNLKVLRLSDTCNIKQVILCLIFRSQCKAPFL